MSNVMNDLHAVGINPFGVVLVAESVLRSPLAPMTVGKPQGFFMPINRSDCPGWAGVRITVEAVPANGGATINLAPQPDGSIAIGPGTTQHPGGAHG